jgi:hypothetical protein
LQALKTLFLPFSLLKPEKRGKPIRLYYYNYNNDNNPEIKPFFKPSGISELRLAFQQKIHRAFQPLSEARQATALQAPTLGNFF